MRKKLVGIVSFIGFITLGFAIASMYVRPNNRDILSLFGLIFPYLYLCALIILPFTFRHHKITFFFGLLLVCFSMKVFLAYVKPFPAKSQKSPSTLVVMSYNTMMGFKMANRVHKFEEQEQRNLDRLLLKEPIPDVVCAQEVNTRVKLALRSTFDNYYEHSIENRGAIILSKYPIYDRGQIDFGSTLNSCLWADIVLLNDTIRIYSTHLESNRLSRSSYEFLEKDQYETKDAINGIKDLLVKYPQYAQKRGTQALQVKEHVLSCSYPVVLCGDFNDPPMSFTYRTIKDNLNDTFLDSGTGFGTTWNGSIPMLRIDYIFASKSLENTSFIKRESDLSDHYPIQASFELN